MSKSVSSLRPVCIPGLDHRWDVGSRLRDPASSELQLPPQHQGVLGQSAGEEGEPLTPEVLTTTATPTSPIYQYEGHFQPVAVFQVKGLFFQTSLVV